MNMKWSLSSALKKNAGFTLIELLVVIAIIAILSTIGLTAFTSAQQRARDARRRGDMKSFQEAAEQYYIANNNAYAAANCAMASLGAVNYLQGGSMPVDPRNVAPNTYLCTNSTTISYCYCATLEAAGSGNSGANCAFAVGGNQFCVANKQ